MSAFRAVYVHPPTGFPDLPWSDDADEDRFARSARRVCEAYSAGLESLDLRGPRGAIKVFCRADPGRTDVLVEVGTDPPSDGPEWARADLVAGIAGLGPDARAGLVLDVAHSAVLQLGRARGWPAGSLQEVRDQVRARGCRFEWTSTGKVSPDRRYAAVARYELRDDGYGRVRIEVRSRNGDQVVARSFPDLAFSTSAGFRRSAATLRWHGTDVVDVIPYCGLSGSREGLLRLDLADPATIDAAPDPAVDSQPASEEAALRPQVVARGVSLSSPVEREIRLIGGGPTNGVPDTYLIRMAELAQTLHSARWLAWWQQAPFTVLEIAYAFGKPTDREVLRANGQQLKATIERTPISVLAEDPPARAEHDLGRLLDAVSRRIGTDTRPDLVTPDT